MQTMSSPYPGGIRGRKSESKNNVHWGRPRRKRGSARGTICRQGRKIIVCLGRIAAMRLISPDIKITREHGIFVEKNGILMMPTLHPAALLRNPAQKPGAFEDFLDLRAKIDELSLL